jgi:uncharacterized membrane protein YeaQ/YmgE (transglycosylase-associated protein family)
VAVGRADQRVVDHGADRPCVKSVSSASGRPEGFARVGRMHLVVFLIVVALIGLVVGALGRFLLPGPDPMGIGGTIMVGLVGAFAAGLFSWYVLHRHGAGLLLSVVFTIVSLALIRLLRGGSTRSS